MLTNKDLNALKEFCEKSHLPILKELAIEAFDELLTLREAVAPKMAEVDEMVRQIKSYPHVNSYEGAMKLASMLCTVILTCEREKHRADELESRYSRFMRRL